MQEVNCFTNTKKHLKVFLPATLPHNIAYKAVEQILEDNYFCEKRNSPFKSSLTLPHRVKFDLLRHGRRPSPPSAVHLQQHLQSSRGPPLQVLKQSGMSPLLCRPSPWVQRTMSSPGELMRQPHRLPQGHGSLASAGRQQSCHGGFQRPTDQRGGGLGSQPSAAKQSEAFAGKQLAKLHNLNNSNKKFMSSQEVELSVEAREIRRTQSTPPSRVLASKNMDEDSDLDDNGPDSGIFSDCSSETITERNSLHSKDLRKFLLKKILFERIHN